MKKCKKAIIILVAALLCQLWAQPIACASNEEFSDVSTTCEEYDEIMEAVELGIFEGVSKGTFPAG